MAVPRRARCLAVNDQVHGIFLADNCGSRVRYLKFLAFKLQERYSLRSTPGWIRGLTLALARLWFKMSHLRSTLNRSEPPGSNRGYPIRNRPCRLYKERTHVHSWCIYVTVLVSECCPRDGPLLHTIQTLLNMGFYGMQRQPIPTSFT